MRVFFLGFVIHPALENKQNETWYFQFDLLKDILYVEDIQKELLLKLSRLW